MESVEACQFSEYTRCMCLSTLTDDVSSKREFQPFRCIQITTIAESERIVMFFHQTQIVAFIIQYDA